MKCLLSAWVLLCAVGVVVAQKGGKDDFPDEEEAESQKKPRLYVDPGTHPAQIREVFFLPDNKQVVTYGLEHSVRLWQVDGGPGDRTIYLPGHFAYHTRHAALSGNGKYLAVASILQKDKKSVGVVHILSMPDGRLVRTLTDLQNWASAVAISHDGKRVAAAHVNSTIRLWDFDKGFDKEPSVRSLRPKGNDRVNALTFSPDGKWLAWISNERGKIIDLTKTSPTDLPAGYSLAWSPDGKTIAIGRKGEVDLLAPDGTAVGKQKFGEENNHSLVFRADSKAILWNGRVLRDLKTGKDEVAFTGKGYLRASVGAISSDGKVIATVSSPLDTTLHIRETNGKEPIRTMKPIVQLASVQNTLAAAWRSDGKAIAWRRPDASKVDNPLLRQGAFDLSKLELLPPLKQAEFKEGVSTRQGDLTITTGDRKLAVKQGEKILAEFEGRLGTFAGKHVVVAASTRNGDIHRIDARTGKKLLTHFNGGFIASNTAISVSPNRRYLLTLHSGGLIQVYSPEQEKQLLRLYVQGDDWVVWTPGGYYAASPGGEKLVRWKVGNGIDKLPTIYSADRFRKKLYRPDVVMKAFELGSVQKALEALHGKGAKEAQIDALLPPTVAVEVVKQVGNSVTVKVTAKAQVAAQPVASLRLMLNGRPFPDLDAVMYDRQPNVTWTKTATLDPGKHTLGALVHSEDASARAEPVSVVVKGAVKLPRLHVLSVGIGDYGKGIPKLTSAANDARDLTKAFGYAKKGGLFAEVVTHELTDKTATSKAIRDKFLALRKVVEREDIVVVFFAGHGTRSKGDFYFLTHDSDVTKLGDDNALSGKRLAESLRALGCKVLLLLDAGHSGTANLTPTSDEAARGLAEDDVGVTVLTAAQGKQKPLARDGNGLFARAIKEALDDRSTAYRAGDGRMFVHHLYAHVSDRVAELSNFGQTPYLRLPEGVPPLALRRFDTK